MKIVLIPVCRAHPAMEGTIASRPATVAAASTRPLKIDPMMLSWWNSSPTASFPFAARALIDASQELYERVARLQERLDAMSNAATTALASPARALLDRLNTAF